MSNDTKIDIVDLYQQMIGTAAMVSDDDGYISTQLASSEKHPTLVKGKRLVLPTITQLRGASAESSIIFHPLSENTLRGESDVMTVFRNHIIKRLNFTLAYLTIALMDLAIATEKHPKLNPEQSMFLSIVKNADATTAKVLKEITSKIMVSDEEGAFVHLYIKRGGVMDNRKWSRVCNVSFPLYAQLEVEPEPRKPILVQGEKLRKVDRESLLGLIKFILPDLGKKEAYWGASISQTAPTIDALMKSVEQIASRINDVAALFSDYIEDVDSIVYDLEYMKVFDNLEAILPQIRAIPMQLGNEGSVPNTSGQSTAPAITVHTPVVQTSPYTATPTQVQTVSAPTGPSIQESPYVQRTHGQPQHQPIQQQQYQPVYQAPVYAPVVQPPVYQPVPVQQVPQYIPNPAYQAPVQQAPGLVKTENGLNLDSIFQSNPQLAQQTAMRMGVMGGGYGAMMPNMQVREPSWAARPMQPVYQPYQNPGQYQGGFRSGI